MATIKTVVNESGVRRVITKLVDEERKVSCACCTPTVCCMYPADQLGVGYSEADLPDEVRITIAGVGGDSRIAARSGSEYSYGSYGAISNLKLGVVDGAWVFIPNADNLSAYVQACLDGEEAEFTVEDTFAHTYEVSGPVSGTVTRQNTCVWTGAGLTLSNYGYQWTVNGNAKSGNQNTPVGSYANGYSVSA